jgi:hypothetical protein
MFRPAALFTDRFTMTGGFMKRFGIIPVFALALSLAGLPGLAAAVEVGEKAPDFELVSTKEGKFKLSSLAGKKNVVIQFYVLDFAPT